LKKTEEEKKDRDNRDIRTEGQGGAWDICHMHVLAKEQVCVCLRVFFSVCVYVRTFFLFLVVLSLCRAEAEERPDV